MQMGQKLRTALGKRPPGRLVFKVGGGDSQRFRLFYTFNAILMVFSLQTRKCIRGSSRWNLVRHFFRNTQYCCIGQCRYRSLQFCAYWINQFQIRLVEFGVWTTGNVRMCIVVTLDLSTAYHYLL